MAAFVPQETGAHDRPMSSKFQWLCQWPGTKRCSFVSPQKPGPIYIFIVWSPPNMPPPLPPLDGRQTANLITLFTGLTFFWYLANCCVYCNYWLLVRVNHYNRAIFYFQFQTFPSCCTRPGCLRGFHNESQWKDALNLKILHRLVQG